MSEKAPFARAESFGVEYFHLPDWTADRVRHGFFGCGVDSRAERARCTELVQAACGPFPVRFLQQVHGCSIVEASNVEDAPRADGWHATADSSPCILGIETADCAPVLLVSANRAMVAALHCGWRGAVAGLLREGIAKFHSLGIAPNELEIAVGPCAGPCCYEFGEELIKSEFSNADKASLTRRAEKLYLDLSGLLRQQAVTEGVPDGHIRHFPGCTICDPRFFSFRRQKGDAGRQLSFISTHSVRNFHK